MECGNTMLEKIIASTPSKYQRCGLVEAQKAIDETRSLRCKVHLSEEAQRAARGMEQDYEDVVRLLEQEIASLKHQMAKQIVSLNQKRLAVLTCQLRKAEAGKKTYEVATENCSDLLSKFMK
ncbi:hypothetical protein ScPMuIL_010994 [Solemya velum]